MTDVRQIIQEAEIVLIGFGREFNIKRQDILNSNELYKRLSIEESVLEDNEKLWIELSVMYDCLKSTKCDIIEKRRQLYNDVYNYLEENGKNNYFVVTTCFDDIIFTSSFDESKIVAPCGTLMRMKCDGGCFKYVYDTKEVYDNINGILTRHNEAGTLNCEEMWLELREAMPQCPMCKRVMSVNIVKTNNYSEEGYRESWDSYMAWLQRTLNRKLVMLELGEGFDTPTVMRWPFEKVASVNNKAVLIRVNDKFWQVSEDIEEKAISVKSGGIDFLKEIMK